MLEWLTSPLRTPGMGKRLKESLGYTAIYLLIFSFLEMRRTSVHIWDTWIDEKIPFCEYFIIPYYLWFGFVALAMAYFVLYAPDQEYYGYTRCMFWGSNFYLLMCFLVPNGTLLRPYLQGENIFEQLVLLIYRIDSCTNVFPSMHVYNALCACIAFCGCKALKNHKTVRYGIIFLTLSIIASTVLLKQHTLWDIIGAVVYYGICYLRFYKQIPLRTIFSVGLLRRALQER